MSPSLWAILLLIAGVFFLILEVFIPSAGTLLIGAACCLIASVAIGFAEHWKLGVTMLISVLVSIPAAAFFAVRLWPNTPIGRRMLLPKIQNPEDVLPQGPDRQEKKSLIGQYGLAKNEMLPNGMVSIDGKTYDAVSEGMMIEAGCPIQVVAVQTNQLVVRPAESRPDPDPPADSLDAEIPGLDFWEETSS